LDQGNHANGVTVLLWTFLDQGNHANGVTVLLWTFLDQGNRVAVIYVFLNLYFNCTPTWLARSI
jgi:hypothetical protein